MKTVCNVKKAGLRSGTASSSNMQFLQVFVNCFCYVAAVFLKPRRFVLSHGALCWKAAYARPCLKSEKVFLLPLLLIIIIFLL